VVFAKPGVSEVGEFRILVVEAESVFTFGRACCRLNLAFNRSFRHFVTEEREIIHELRHQQQT